MTEEEAKTLKPGDRIQTQWTYEVVRNPAHADNPNLILCRTHGTDAPEQLVPIPYYAMQRVEVINALLIADWLEENGEPAAATKVRTKFIKEIGCGPG